MNNTMIARSVNPTQIAKVMRESSAVLLALAGLLEESEAPAAPSDLLGIDEAAALVGVGKKAIRRRIAAGDLAAARPPGSRCFRVRRADVEALFAPKLRAPAPKPVRAAVMSEDDKLAAAIEGAGISLRRSA